MLDAPSIEMKVTTLPADQLAADRERALATVAERLGSDEWQRMNRFEARLAELPQIENMPLTHTFTPVPGYPELWLYTRTIVNPKDALLTTRIHLYECPFMVLRGAIGEWDDSAKEWVIRRAGYVGVTKPGTRRIIYCIEEATVATCHVTRSKDPNEIHDLVTYDHEELGHLDQLPPERRDLILSHALEKQTLQ